MRVSRSRTLTTEMMHWREISHCRVVRHKSSEVEVEIVDIKSPSKVWIHLIEDSACRSMGGAWTSYRVQAGKPGPPIESRLKLDCVCRGLVSFPSTDGGSVGGRS